ncbi:MAG: lipid-A-disaccharide synthase, partial [Pseudomonadota bacterium]
PGSRMSEVALMIDEFLGAAALFSRQHEPTMIVIPCLRETLRARIEQAIQDAGLNNVVVYEGNARQALIAADLVLVKSGTSTLEAMLVGRAMVVSYKLGGLTYQIARRVVRTPYVALPNILADQPLVPELLQDAASASALAAELAVQAREAAADSPLRRQFAALHDELRQGADAKAAAAVLGLLSSRFDRKR